MSDSVNQSKTEMRKRLRSALAAMTDEQRHDASVNVCNRVMALEAFDHAATVMVYMPIANEVDVTPIALRCFRTGKSLCVPKVDWIRREIAPVEVTSLDDRVMDCDEHGVRVPKQGKPVHPGIIDLVIVPGLGFDPQGNRLGRSAGYYDRFLSRLKPSTTTVGVAFDQQIVDKVPTQSHDVAVHVVVTDRRVSLAKAARAKA
jgi:5-formyltetrahydrofolate cyclo-ligase